MRIETRNVYWRWNFDLFREGSHGPNFQNLVIQSAVAILAPLVGELKVREYLQKSLLLELDLEKAMPKIRRCVKTLFQIEVCF